MDEKSCSIHGWIMWMEGFTANYQDQSANYSSTHVYLLIHPSFHPSLNSLVHTQQEDTLFFFGFLEFSQIVVKYKYYCGQGCGSGCSSPGSGSDLLKNRTDLINFTLLFFALYTLNKKMI